MVADLSDTDILALDYDGKVKLLERVAQRILDIQVEYAKIAGRHAELKAEIEVLKQVKSALQSAIRAEGFM
jgi:hypothetical protein